jgi:hypothetical protein
MRVEDVDLAELARGLRDDLGHAPAGYLPGRTELRDRTVQRLGCSELQAEQIVDTMIARRFVSYDDSEEPAGPEGVWRFRESLA